MNEREPIKVEAILERNPRMDGPLGRTVSLGFRISGEEIITIPDPGIGEDFASAIQRRLSNAQMRAVTKAGFEFADRVYAMIYAACGTAADGADHSERKPEHPSAALRREIEAQGKHIDDLKQRLTIAETQRDELRRLFVEPVMITGLDGPVVQS